jgi:hypothetical protein
MMSIFTLTASGTFIQGPLREGEVRYTTPNMTLPTRNTFTPDFRSLEDFGSLKSRAGWEQYQSTIRHPLTRAKTR